MKCNRKRYLHVLIHLRLLSSFCVESKTFDKHCTSLTSIRNIYPLCRATIETKAARNAQPALCTTSSLHKVVLKLKFFFYLFFLLQGQSITGNCQKFYMYPSHRSWLGSTMCFSVTVLNSYVHTHARTHARTRKLCTMLLCGVCTKGTPCY